MLQSMESQRVRQENKRLNTTTPLTLLNLRCLCDI